MPALFARRHFDRSISVTGLGTALGTPIYTSPERVAAEIVHAPDDIAPPSDAMAPTTATLRALTASSEADLARGLWVAAAFTR